MCDIEHPRIHIDRAGIVEGNAATDVGKSIALLVVGAAVVEGAGANHLVGKGIGIGEGAGIVEGAAAEEKIVGVGTSVAAPGGVVSVHYAPAGNDLGAVAADVQGAVEGGGGCTGNRTSCPVSGAADRGARAGQGASRKQEVGGMAATIKIDRAAAYLKSARSAGGGRVQVMGAEVEIQGGTRGHGKAAAVGVIPLQAQGSGIHIDRAGIVEGNAATDVGKSIALLVVGAAVVEGAGANHLVSKGIGIGEGAGIVEGAAAEEKIVGVGTSIAAPGGVVSVHYAPAGNDLGAVAADVQGAVEGGGGCTGNRTSCPVSGAADRGARAGQGASRKQEVGGMAATIKIDRAAAYLKSARSAGGGRVQVMGAEVEIQGGTRGHGKAAAVGVIPLQAQGSGIHIDRAGIVEGNAATDVGKSIALLVVGAAVVEGAGANHLVSKGIGIGEGAGIVEGAAAEEKIVGVGTSIAAPGGVVSVHYAPAGNDLGAVAADVQGAVEGGGGCTGNRTSCPVSGAADRGARAGQGASRKQEVGGMAATIKIDRAAAYLKSARSAGGGRVQVMGAEVEIQGGTRGHGKAAAVGVIPLQAQGSGIHIDRAGIVEGNAAADGGNSIVLLVVGAAVVEGAGADHLVGKRVGIGEGTRIVEGAPAKEEIVDIGAGVAAPGGIVGVYDTPAGNDLGYVTADVQGAVEGGGGRTRNRTSCPDTRSADPQITSATQGTTQKI